MKVPLSFNHLLLFFFASLLFSASCSARPALSQLPIRAARRSIPFDNPTSRIGFVNTSTQTQTIVLIQENGLIDYYGTLVLVLPPTVTGEDVTFTQQSDNEQVLNVSAGGNIASLAHSPGVLNVTISLSFDGLVGKSTYTLVAKHKVTQENLDTIAINFIIVGMTFYREGPSGSTEVVSGDGNQLSISYEDALNTVDISLKVMIQYADGTSSETLTGGVIPNGESMLLELSGDTGQVVHDSANCNVNSIGIVSTTGELELPASCGCGFYFASGSLHFGCAFEPFRTGELSIHFSWPGVTAGLVQNEALDLFLNVDITGTPPVAVVGIEPSSDSLRPEGGEIRTVQLINVQEHEAASFQIRVDSVAEPFEMVPGSYKKPQSPDFEHSVSLITQPGTGLNLTWWLYFQRYVQIDNNSVLVYEKAAFAPTMNHTFSYDDEDLKIGKIEPKYGSEEGGENITITGYFPNFNKDHDGIFFSSYKLDSKYILAVTETKIVFRLPPREVFGSGYEFNVRIKIGLGQSNDDIFSYFLYDATVKMSHIGASLITDGVYRIGDCSKPRFTAIVAPYSSQLIGFQWGLHLSNVSNNLLDTPEYASVNSTAQIIELDSDIMESGMYSLKVEVKLIKFSIESEIVLMRQNVTTIGTSILPVLNRTIPSPDAPLRFVAVVDDMGSCHTEDMTGKLVFEWEGFGTTKRFSSDGTTPSASDGAPEISVGRLGWEFIVPREFLKVGSYEITFKTWIKGNEQIAGRAVSTIFILSSPLVAKIRSGETQVTSNYLSELKMTAVNSYDPDVPGDGQYDGLKYEWSCRQSASQNFSEGISSPCIEEFIPTATQVDFVAKLEKGKDLADVRFLQYSLNVTKEDGREAGKTSFIVEMEPEGELPSLSSYNISLTDAEGTLLEWEDVSYYEDLVLSVSAPENTTWTYELIEPSEAAFFSSINLVKYPSYYSPPRNISEPNENQLPLGLRAGALHPITTYFFKIVFDGSADYQQTQVIITISTKEAASVGPPTLSSWEGTTSTYFTAVATSTAWTNWQAYYFMITDSDGNEVCAGGCTGHQISHFRIKRSGSYIVTSHMVDMQGKALLSSTQALKNLTVQEMTMNETATTNMTTSVTAVEVIYETLLHAYIDNGNDQSWTQMAQDVAIAIFEDDVQRLSGTARFGMAREARLAAQMDVAASLANDSTKIFCNTYPNSYYGRDCVLLLYWIARLRTTDDETVYNLMQSASCCIKNTPQRTVINVLPALPNFITQINKMTRDMTQGGISRTRLLRSVGARANAVADVQLWSGAMMADSAASGKLEGFTGQYNMSHDKTAGHVSVAVASKVEDLPASDVNGVSRNILRGPSGNELFYPRKRCLSKLFEASTSKRRIFVMQTTDNFVTLGFQDPPIRSNLVEKLYWTQVYERDDNGKLEEVSVRQDGYCYCWRLPVSKFQKELERSIEDMPGLFGVTKLKKFGERVDSKGSAFKYVYDGSKTSEYNVTEGWVEGCRSDIGMVSTTIVSKKSSNVIADGGALILGLGGLAFVGLVITGLLLVIVAVVVSWLIAVRSMGGEQAVAVGDGEVFVERDVYGRGTVIDANVGRMRSAN